MNICVYCSASITLDPVFHTIAAQLGRGIAERGDVLVYGGGSTGLMGEIARAVHAGGGKVQGVIPQALVEREQAYHTADELIVTQDMRQRKAEMERRADAFVVLPGGIGTLDELFEILSLRQLKLTTKPLVVLNQNGFYDPLYALLTHMRDASFLRTPLDVLLGFAPDVAGVFAYVDAHYPQN
jgi:uncharacterized protein (TIGR00730 family)